MTYEVRRTLLGSRQGSLCGKFSPDGMYVCLGGYDAEVYVFSINAGWDKPAVVLNTTMTEGRDLKSPITSITFRPVATFSTARNVVLVTSSDGGVSHWHLGSAKQIHAFHEAGNQVLAADYSPSGLQYATSGMDAKIRLYDEEKQQVVTCLSEGLQQGFQAHTGRVQALKWVDDHTIISGGWDYTVQVWDVRQPTPVRTIFGPYIVGDGLDAKGSQLVTGSNREKDSLELWDWTSGKKVMGLAWPEAPVADKKAASDPDPVPVMQGLMCAKFSNSGRFVAAGGKNDFRIFDLKANGAVAGGITPLGGSGTPHCVFNAHFSSDDKECLVTGAGHESYVLRTAAN